jgi:hypothetical protein
MAGAMAALVCLSLPVLARPLVPAEHRFDWYLGRLPTCGDPSVLSRIQSRFFERESEFWKSGLQVVGFDNVREIGMRTNGLDYIPRRYCTGQALLNNQTAHKVTYSIVEDQGFIGLGFGVDWCIVGFDRLYSYAPNCRMALP